MFDAPKLITAYSNLLGWKQHYDPTDFQIDVALTVSESGEFYQQKHPGLDLANIRAVLPQGFTLDSYLREVITDSTVEMFNDVLQYRQVSNYGKTLLNEAILLNSRGFNDDKIINQNRFVGFQITLKAATGLRMTIDQIGLQFTGVESFNMYLFHSSKEDFIEKFPVTTDGNNSWKWNVKELILESMKSTEFQGGVFVLGYYQEDVVSTAINYTSFNWHQGECASCNRARHTSWKAVTKYFHIFPLFVPQGSFIKEKMFDIEDAFFVHDQSFGMNLKLTTECDLTQFFIDNKVHFKNLLAIKVTHKVLYRFKFSQQTNFIEENLKHMIIRDLEGDKDTNHLNISQQYNREMRAVKFNTGAINSLCLDCEDSATVPVVSEM